MAHDPLQTVLSIPLGGGPGGRLRVRDAILATIVVCSIAAYFAIFTDRFVVPVVVALAACYFTLETIRPSRRQVRRIRARAQGLSQAASAELHASSSGGCLVFCVLGAVLFLALAVFQVGGSGQIGARHLFEVSSVLGAMGLCSIPARTASNSLAVALRQRALSIDDDGESREGARPVPDERATPRFGANADGV